MQQTPPHLLAVSGVGDEFTAQSSPPQALPLHLLAASSSPPVVVTATSQNPPPADQPPCVSAAQLASLNPRQVQAGNSYERAPPVPAHAFHATAAARVQNSRAAQGMGPPNATATTAPASTHSPALSPVSSPSAPSIQAATAGGSSQAASIPPASSPSLPSGPSALELALEVARLQAENVAARDELVALRHRLKAMEDHSMGVLPALHHSASNSSVSIQMFNDTSSHAHIHTEQQALAALQQSRAMDMPLPLMKHAAAFDAEPFVRARPSPNTPPAMAASCQQLQSDVGSLLDYLKPSKRSESRRANVLAFLKLLVRKSLGAQVYPLGAYALKTYVGQDEVMDVSAFFSRAHENTWLHRIVNALCQEASSSYHTQHNANALNTTSPHYAVSRLSVSFLKARPFINCCIGGIHCNIFGNHVLGLSNLALLERMDLMCAQEHLFKRTIILVRCYCIAKKILNLASSMIPPSPTDDDLFSHIPVEGLLSGIFMRTLVLYTFNIHASTITSPLEGLYRLLEIVRDFNWDEHALTLYGAVTLASLEAHGCNAQDKWEYVREGPTGWPGTLKPHLSRDVWKQYRPTTRTFNGPTTAQSKSRASPSGNASASSATPLSSPVLVASARSNSDSQLASLPRVGSGLGMQGMSSPSKHMSPHMRPVPVHPPVPTTTISISSAPGTSAVGSRPHSQSFSSLESIPVNHLTSASLRGSMHSHSFSNLSNLNQAQQHGQQLRSVAPGPGDHLLARPFDFRPYGASYSPASASGSRGRTPNDPSSLTPAHSQSDLQNLVIAAPSPSGGRLGFAPTNPTLRSSASTKQLHRLPQPIAASASSSSFFSSHIEDGYSDDEVGDGLEAADTSSPDLDVDDDETHGRIHRIGSAASFDGEESALLEEGAEYLIGESSNTPPPSNVDLPLATQDDEAVTSPPSPTGAPSAPFTRCAMNVLDPLDPTHNLGATISYKHEYHIRAVLREGFLALKNAIQKFAFARAARDHHTPSVEDGDEEERALAEREMHPVILEIFEESQLARHNEQLRREHKLRKMVAAQASASPVLAASSHMMSPPAISLSSTTVETLWSSGAPSSLEQVFQSSGASSFSLSSSSAPSATTSVEDAFAFSASSPLRDRVAPSALSGLNPHSTHFVPTGGSATGPLIVDDLASSTSSDALHTQQASPASSGVFDALSGDLAKIVSNLDHARQFETPDLSEDQLVHLIIDLLKERVSVPVGRMGSLLHDVTNNHSLPAMLKEQFGGLKRYLESHSYTYTEEKPPRTIALGVAHTTSVRSLMADLAAKSGVPIDEQRLVFNGKELDPMRSVDYYGIHESATLHLVLCPGSPSSQPTSPPSMPSPSERRFQIFVSVPATRVSRQINNADIFAVGREHAYNPNVSLRSKWFNFAPPRPVDTLGLGVAMLSMSNHSSSGNLQAMAADGNSRRKLQRRRTRTRRANSGATATMPATSSGQVATQARPAGLLDPAPISHLPSSASVSAAPRTVVTAIVALDCEMVGVGPSGFTSMLARISIVNFSGEVLYDKFVAPTEPVTDYRTSVSGILPSHLEGGLDFRQVQREVSQIVKNRIMVGHGLMADLQALCIVIPPHQLRDTAVCKLFCPHRPLPLKTLVKDHLHTPEWAAFQTYEHNPVHDARAALALYKLAQNQWEAMVQAEQIQMGQHASSQPLAQQQQSNLMQHAHAMQQQLVQHTPHQQQQAPSLLQPHHSAQFIYQPQQQQQQQQQQHQPRVQQMQPQQPSPSRRHPQQQSQPHSTIPMHAPAYFLPLPPQQPQQQHHQQQSHYTDAPPHMLADFQQQQQQAQRRDQVNMGSFMFA